MDERSRLIGPNCIDRKSFSVGLGCLLVFPLGEL